MSIRCFHSFRLLAPGIALMLVALFPMTARANTAGQVYELAVPHIKSDPSEKVPRPEAPERSHPVHPTEPEVTEPDRSPAPTTGDDAAHRTPTKPNAVPKPKERHRHQEVPPVKTENHPPAGGAQQSKWASAGVPESAADGDGSTPVVPILIAVALLAAASIGIVLYRERKSRTGPVNP